MRRYVLLALGMVAFLLVLFALAELLDIPVLTDPGRTMTAQGWAAAGVGVTLLVVDIFVPVPSSVVMVLHGTLFGTVAGAALSLVGRTGFAVAGFALGRSAGDLVGRVVGPAERARADELMARWGALSIVVSRPVPLLSETVIILAGASSMRWPVAMVAAVAGALPEVIAYAIVGAQLRDFNTTVAVFLPLVAIGCVAQYVLARRRVARAR
jgi:uncharacterized membrane protein YdjX (TVP38/TMEM64 family)